MRGRLSIKLNCQNNGIDYVCSNCLEREASKPQVKTRPSKHAERTHVHEREHAFEFILRTPHLRTPILSSQFLPLGCKLESSGDRGHGHLTCSVISMITIMHNRDHTRSRYIREAYEKLN